MKEMITVTRTGDAIRVSRVTPHGETVIEPDMEAKALAVLLWSYMTKGDPSEGTSLLPWSDIRTSLATLTAEVGKLSAELRNTQHMLSVHRAAAEAAQKTTPVRNRGQ